MPNIISMKQYVVYVYKRSIYSKNKNGLRNPIFCSTIFPNYLSHLFQHSSLLCNQLRIIQAINITPTSFMPIKA